MKKRILFVDDEPMVLQGIQRLLRSMRQEWEMDFAEGGEQAKERLATTVYDVVVTDMVMPGIDGAELLDHVRQLSPKTIRLVLSGHAEQHLAMKCVGIAHQYLSKPCDAGMLKSTVERVIDPHVCLRSEQVMTLVSGLKHLPSIPVTYSKIVQVLGDPNASMDEVGALIAGDMAMTAKVLQIVNSSFFGLARQVSRPTEAAAYLGLDTLKALVLATSVFHQFSAKMPKSFSPMSISDHGQAVGAAARAIAQAEDAPRLVADEALVSGLLHDVGKLVLASSLPDEFERVSGMDEPNVLAAEREVFGATHAEVGGYLLGLWGLPPSVIEAICFHHTPCESRTAAFSALTAVHAADHLIHEIETARSGGANSCVDLEYLAQLGLAERLPVWRAVVEETLHPNLQNQ
jgi:HD-like signal output (HDOD) protein/ActR/RegA family two-component response regulator